MVEIKGRKVKQNSGLGTAAVGANSAASPQKGRQLNVNSNIKAR